MRSTSRVLVLSAVMALAVACGTAPAPHESRGATATTSTASVPATAARAAFTTGHSAWVAVSVARLWQSPTAPRPVDAPALKAPVRFRAWLRAMTLSQRRALDLHSDTEALWGERVVVVRLRPGWAKVVVPSQPSQKDSRGYPGWVPLRQLTATTPRRTADLATVTTRTAWLRSDDTAATRTAEISFGTDLPVLGRTGGYLRVATPRGAVRRIAARAVVVHARNTPAIAPTAASLVRSARTFLGLPYLWGGLSGFGLDCSGLVWLDHRAHGITIPRDALPQSQHGRVVTKRAPGDLLFYAHNGLVHHVTMYIGNGQVIQAPHTGASVEISAFSAQPLRSEYVGARRYLN